MRSSHWKHHCAHQVDLFLTWSLFSPSPHAHYKCIYRPDFMISLWNHILPDPEDALKITEPHLYNSLNCDCIKWLPGIRHSSKCSLQFYSLICTTTPQSRPIMIPILQGESWSTEKGHKDSAKNTQPVSSRAGHHTPMVGFGSLFPRRAVNQDSLLNPTWRLSSFNAIPNKWAFSFFSVFTDRTAGNKLGFSSSQNTKLEFIKMPSMGMVEW